MGGRVSSIKRTAECIGLQNNGKDMKVRRRKGRRDSLHRNEHYFARPRKLEILLDRPPVPQKAQELNGWNSEDRSMNMYVKDEDVRIAHRHPVAQSTDAIRGSVGYNEGLHVWDITWNVKQRGTHAVVGIATKDAALNIAGYHCLVGSNTESWGWDINRNRLFHNQKTSSSETFPRNLPVDSNFIVPDKIRCILDMDLGTLAFEIDGQYLGIAFTGLKGKTVYPCVSAVWGHCEIGLHYVGYLHPEPLPLMDLARLTIRQSIGKENLTGEVLEQLDLTRQMQQYLVYKW